MHSEKTLISKISQRCTRATHSNIFLECDNGRVSYKELTSVISGLRGFFAQNGLDVASRIGVLARHPADIAALTLSAFSSGVAIVVLNPEFTEEEVARAFKDCSLDTLFCERSLTANVPAAVLSKIVTFDDWSAKAKGSGLLKRLRRKADTPSVATLTALVQGIPPIDRFDDLPGETVALLLNTSGTTSAPKVVELTHDNIAHQLEAFSTVYNFDETCRILNPLPLHFTDGLFHGPIHTFVTGATLYRPIVFDMAKFEDLLNTVYRDQITHFIVVPAILALMDRLGNEFTDTFETESFRYIRSSGDRLPERLWASVQDRFGVQVINTYGMSETVCEAFYCGPDPESFRLGTIGKAVGCDWRIVDEAGNPVETGQKGELQLKGGIVTAGYAGQSEMTRTSFEQDWFRTGDLAMADEDDFVTIVGRSKELIIAGGVNVHPQEIVDCLMGHNDILDAAVCGMQHGVWGEQIAAALVLKDGKEMNRTEILAHCRQHIAPHKMPRILKSLDHLPRNAAGKVQVKELLAQFQAKDISGGSTSEETVANQVLARAAEIFGVEESSLHGTDQPDDVAGWDSFAHLTLVTALEAQFDISFSAREILRIERLSDLVDIITKKLN